jgi:3-hydroxybutyryl-CoA dehydrogenase
LQILSAPLKTIIKTDKMSIKNITVIGSGTMGNGIAHVCAQFGYQVSLVDIAQSALDKAIATITKNLDRQVQKGAITEEVKTADAFKY